MPYVETGLGVGGFPAEVIFELEPRACQVKTGKVS